MGLQALLHALWEEASLAGGQGRWVRKLGSQRNSFESRMGRPPTGPVKRLRLLAVAWDTGLEGGKVWHPLPRAPFPSPVLQCDMLSCDELGQARVWLMESVMLLVCKDVTCLVVWFPGQTLPPPGAVSPLPGLPHPHPHQGLFWAGPFSHQRVVLRPLSSSLL